MKSSFSQVEICLSTYTPWIILCRISSHLQWGLPCCPLALTKTIHSSPAPLRYQILIANSVSSHNHISVLPWVFLYIPAADFSQFVYGPFFESPYRPPAQPGMSSTTSSQLMYYTSLTYRYHLVLAAMVDLVVLQQSNLLTKLNLG
jgi:hypothetical protein